MSKTTPKDSTIPRRRFVQKAAAGLAAAALGGVSPKQTEAAARSERHWDLSADVVIVGSGAAGLPASIAAAEAGASVIIVEQNYDIGGHGIQSGGNIALGGGTSLQKKYGVADTPDKMFEALVNWRDYRFSDREIVRAFCDESVATFEFLVAHGVKFPDHAPLGADGGPHDLPRAQIAEWSGEVSTYAPNGGNGAALIRPLEASARKLGVQILLLHSMTGVIREQQFSGPVLGVTASHEGKTLNIQAKRGVILSTGGHTSNVTFRRMFDPRLTEEYQVVGEPYSRQSGDGEIAAMQVGAALWGAASQTVETKMRSHVFEKPYVIGNQYGYPHGGGERPDELKNSPIKGLAHAIGLQVADYQNLIQVNQFGRRFVNELATGFDWWNPCLEQSGMKAEGGGPIWAIFDADGAKREDWTVAPPYVDPNGWFFSGTSLHELAGKIVSKYQKEPMPGAALEETVARYNSFVERGADEDFKKPKLQFKIQTPPFYAAWSTPCVHDCLSGIRINGKAQVIDLWGKVVPGLYCAGETAGGFNQHGLARSLTFGKVAGREAATRT
ncbi:MAG TPA: FAD-dependent oxidoreductase [Candidatus Acidoferrales bacterium]|nr:FAD-dependent oxidoreductase [Candidatus Acidoferrales bacterium]